ncbi:MAG: hypothetical protein R3B84_20975 [Zavarzinella sp.]
MHRFILFVWLIVHNFVVASFGAAQDHDPEILKAISAWKRRQHEYPIFQYQYTPFNTSYDSGVKRKPFSLGDITMAVDFANERTKIATKKIDKKDRTGKRFTESIEIYNGKFNSLVGSIYFDGKLDTTIADNPKYMIQKGVVSSSLMYSQYHCILNSYACLLLQPGDDTRLKINYTPDPSWLSVHRILPENHIEFQTRPYGKFGTYYNIIVDSTKDYAIKEIRRFRKSPGEQPILQEAMQFDYQYTESYWLPKSMVLTTFNTNGTPSVVSEVKEFIATKISDPNSLFRSPIPEGTPIDQWVIPDGGGNTRFVLDKSKLSKAVVKDEELLQVEVNRDGTYEIIYPPWRKYLIFGLLSANLFLVLLLVYRRYSK